MERKRVGIVLFENIEVLDFCGPFEVFSVTRLNEERRREEKILTGSDPCKLLILQEERFPRGALFALELDLGASNDSG